MDHVLFIYLVIHVFSIINNKNYSLFLFFILILFFCQASLGPQLQVCVQEGEVGEAWNHAGVQLHEGREGDVSMQASEEDLLYLTCRGIDRGRCLSLQE